MRVSVDASLLTPTSAVGRVSGDLDLPGLPTVGQQVSLHRSANIAAGFSGGLAVTDVIAVHLDAGPEPAVLLEDIVASTKEEGAAIGRDLERQYGLFFEPYDS